MYENKYFDIVFLVISNRIYKYIYDVDWRWGKKDKIVYFTLSPLEAFSGSRILNISADIYNIIESMFSLKIIFYVLYDDDAVDEMLS